MTESKGVATEENVKNEILKLASDKEEHSQAYFEKNIDVARGTLRKYLRSIVEEDKLIDVSLSSDKKHRVVYKINEKGLKKASRIKTRIQFDGIFDNLSDEQIRNYAGVMIQMLNSPEGSMWFKENNSLSYFPPNARIAKLVAEIR